MAQIKDIEYKCPCCGGTVEFNSSVQKMKCPYCDTEFEMSALQELDQAIQDSQDSDMTWDTSDNQTWQPGETEGMRVYTCKSCGGEIVADETVSATTCPYCDNAIVMTGQFMGTLKPAYVIPFKFDKAAAKNKLAEHLVGKKLLPASFRSQNHIDEIKGIYVPFWLFDTGAIGKIRYKATKERRWSDNDFNYKETSFFSVFREGTLKFRNIPVNGATKIEDQLMESIEPFDFKDAVPFQTAYLAGYMADKYDVDSKESEKRANDRVTTSVEQEIRETVSGYDSVQTEGSSIHLFGGKAQYVLYPVWLLNSTWEGKKYTFAMNGQTGKFVGDLPMDKSAYWKSFALSGVIGTVVSFALLMLFSMM